MCSSGRWTRCTAQGRRHSARRGARCARPLPVLRHALGLGRHVHVQAPSAGMYTCTRWHHACMCGWPNGACAHSTDIRSCLANGGTSIGAVPGVCPSHAGAFNGNSTASADRAAIGGGRGGWWAKNCAFSQYCTLACACRPHMRTRWCAARRRASPAGPASGVAALGGPRAAPSDAERPGGASEGVRDRIATIAGPTALSCKFTAR